MISTGFLTSPDKPMIMRGPMLHSAILPVLHRRVKWGELDYMIVDLPPGTGDAPLSLAQSFPLTGARLSSPSRRMSPSPTRCAARRCSKR
ncbi:MAG: P-loop NTPase [Anaerolineae bacterium]